MDKVPVQCIFQATTLHSFLTCLADLDLCNFPVFPSSWFDGVSANWLAVGYTLTGLKLHSKSSNWRSDEWLSTVPPITHGTNNLISTYFPNALPWHHDLRRAVFYCYVNMNMFLYSQQYRLTYFFMYTLLYAEKQTQRKFKRRGCEKKEYRMENANG